MNGLKVNIAGAISSSKFEKKLFESNKSYILYNSFVHNNLKQCILIFLFKK